MFGTQRTGVRLVLSDSADSARLGEFSDWYDAYGAALVRIGHLANSFRFENPAEDRKGRFAAIYDIVTPDPATAWPATESSPDYPTALFDDPRSTLVVPAFRASYALVGTAARPGAPGTLTGVYIALSDGGADTGRQIWASQILETGLFSSVSRFRAIDGMPQPPDWFEIFETDDPDPLTAYARAQERAEPGKPNEDIRYRSTGAYRLVSPHTPPR